MQTYNAMMLYLTGAKSSIKVSPDSPQTDPALSLGGYVSSSPVPNGALNVLFDEVSLLTLQNRPTECIAVALVNRLTQRVSDVTIAIAGADDDQCDFEIAAVAADNFQMEAITSRYNLPIQAQFHNASFRRAGVEVTIDSPAQVGEEFVLNPFDILVEGPKTADYDGTFAAVEAAFASSSVYQAVRKSEKVFRIERRDLEAVEPFTVSVTTEVGGTLRLTFDGDFRNAVNNTVTLTDMMNPDQCIGLWLKRTVKKSAVKDCCQMFEDYDNKVVEPTVERVQLIINYNPVEERSYSDEYNEQEYS